MILLQLMYIVLSLDVMAPLTNNAGASHAELLDTSLTNKIHRLSLATFDDEGNFVSFRTNQPRPLLTVCLFFFSPPRHIKDDALYRQDR